MKDKISTYFVQRKSNFYTDEFIKSLLKSIEISKKHNYEKIINNIKLNENFMEALLIASPSLYKSLHNFQKLSDKKQKVAFLSLVEYMKRSTTRVTPFGLFSSVKLIDNEKNDNVSPKKLQRHIRIAPEWLLLLYNDLIEAPNEMPEQQLVISATLVDHHDYYANYVIGENPVFSEDICIRYEKSPLLTSVIEIIREYPRITLIDLLSKLNEIDSNINIFEVVSIVTQLLRERCLFNNLYPEKGFSIKEFRNYINKIKSFHPTFKYLSKLNRIVKLGRRYEEEGGISNYKSLSLALSNLYSTKNAIIVDSESFENSLNVQDINNQQYNDIKELGKTLIRLSNLMPNMDKFAIENYRAKFIEKYGYYTEVSLLKVFDENFGIGSPFSDVKLSKLQINRQSKFIQYLIDEQNKSCLKNGFWDLADIDLDKIDTSNMTESILNTTIDLNFKYFEDTNSKNKFFVLGHSPSSFYGNGFNSRFSYFLQQPALDQKRQNPYLLQYLPQNKKVANIFYSGKNPSRKVLINGYEKESTPITLRDISLYVNQNNEFEFHDPNGEKVIFDQGCMANVNLESEVIKFLVIVSSPNYYIPELIGLINNLRSTANDLVKYKNIILSPKRWSISKEVIMTNLSQPEELHRIFKEMGIPEKVNLVRADQLMPISITSDTDIQIIERYCQRTKERQIVFEEKYLNNKCELTFTLEFQREHSFKKRRTINIDNRIRYPQDWIYVKLYLPKSEEDHLLKKNILNFVKTNKLDKWFFIRYKDPKNHIRFRIQNKDNKNLINRLMVWVESLRERKIISTYAIVPYYRELERYGGSSFYEDIESIFYFDSLLSITLLKSQSFQKERILLNLKDILTNLQLPTEMILNILKNEKLKDKVERRNYSTLKEHINEMPLEQVEAIEKLNYELVNLINKVVKNMLSRDEFSKEYISEWLNSLIHMHFNRLNGNLEYEQIMRTQEFRMIREYIWTKND